MPTKRARDSRLDAAGSRGVQIFHAGRNPTPARAAMGAGAERGAPLRNRSRGAGRAYRAGRPDRLAEASATIRMAGSRPAEVTPSPRGRVDHARFSHLPTLLAQLRFPAATCRNPATSQNVRRHLLAAYALPFRQPHQSVVVEKDG